MDYSTFECSINNSITINDRSETLRVMFIRIDVNNGDGRLLSWEVKSFLIQE